MQSSHTLFASHSSHSPRISAVGAVSIHPCSEGDIEAIQAIYAHYVATNLATFELEPPTAQQMLSRRADILGGGYPYLVARLGGEVVGYAYGSAYRSRPAYRHTVEDSIYVAPGHRQAGIGNALLRELIAQCAQRGFRQMVGVVGNSANTGSLRVHEALGFSRVGTLASVGHKFGQWVDTVLMQRALGEGDSTPAVAPVAGPAHSAG
ncbi:N-acetyltransferase family protein [Polaromonas sp.]|uniref:GNAT family N-acetyltransferase n=1 Tax=Polaromonas sp. TaxID=1869339 RepID=UPI0032638829